MIYDGLCSFDNTVSYKFNGSSEEFHQLAAIVRDKEGFIDRSYFEQVIVFDSIVKIEEIIPAEYMEKLECLERS